MKRIFQVPSALLATILAVVCVAPASAQSHPWSMAAQMRVQVQWQRQSMKQNRALIQMQQRAARQNLMLQRRMVRALTPRTHRLLAPRLPRNSPRTNALHRVNHLRTLTASRPASLHRTSTTSKRVRASSGAARNNSGVQIRITVSAGGGRAVGRSGPSSLALKRPGTALKGLLSKSGALSGGRSLQAGKPLLPSQPPSPIASLPPVSPTVPAGQAPGGQPLAAMPMPPSQPLAPAQADKPVPAPVALALLPPPFAPLMHKVADLRMESKPATPDALRKGEPASFFLDSISAPSAIAEKSSSAWESGAMQLVAAIAKGKPRRPAQTETTAIPPDLVRRTPPLPRLQPRHPITPLLAVE